MIVGIGTDIVEIDRIEKDVLRTRGFIDKVFTEKEQAHYQKKNNRAETLAGFFAAKEAVSKALGTGFRKFRLKDIEIVPNALGKPEVYLHKNAKLFSDELKIKHVEVSISHCKEYATAFAIAEGE